MIANKPGHILTHSGRYFSFADPGAHDYQISDIIWGLSHLCRFTGHFKKFYSVAQHSVIVSYMVPPQDAYEGLMHDASEAYLGDVSSPLKAMLPDYKVIEHRTEEAIAKAFGLRYPFPDSVKLADMRVLSTEKRDGMQVQPEDEHYWPRYEPYPPSVLKIKPVSPAAARKMFQQRFNELRGN